ncbi:MAG: hypothetical protein Q9160_006162 [Pyrenula sp. 1 TL-2023]
MRRRGFDQDTSVQENPAERAVYISVPRISYLPSLLPRLLAFFSSSLITPPQSPYDGYFTFSTVPLKWHLPIGLLHDVYNTSAAYSSPPDNAIHPSTPEPPQAYPPPPPSHLPFRLTLHFTPTPLSSAYLTPLTPYPATFHDSFINSAKEADFLRSGTARPIMSLPEASSRALFTSISSPTSNSTSTSADGGSGGGLDFPAWKRVMAELIPKAGEGAQAFRALPVRVYLPTSPPSPSPTPKLSQPDPSTSTSPSPSPSTTNPNTTTTDPPGSNRSTGQIKTLQPHVRPSIPPSSQTLHHQHPQSQQPMTLGAALHSLLPTLFPSKRNLVYARPVLHGAPVPMAAPLEELVRWCGYADGWLGVVVEVL